MTVRVTSTGGAGLNNPLFTEPTHQEVEHLASRITNPCEKVMLKIDQWVDEDNPIPNRTSFT